MRENLDTKVLLRIFFVGLLTTAFRCMEEFLIPQSKAQVLPESIFVKNGIFPIVFIIYALITYMIIARIFFSIKEKMNGNKVTKGLQYGLALGIIWGIYLWEPLPHIVGDIVGVISYSLADLLALVVLGILSGLFFTENKGSYSNIYYKRVDSSQIKVSMIASVTVCFIVCRIIGYKYLNIYSSYNDNTISTLLWTLSTGLIIAIVMSYLYNFVSSLDKLKRVTTLAIVIFGVNILLFNFFTVLVFKMDIVDLLIRTAVDIVGVTLGVAIGTIKEEM